MTIAEATSSLGVDHIPGSIERIGVINHSGLSDEVVYHDPGLREVAKNLSKWVDNARSAIGRTSMFDRGMFTPDENWYSEVRAARNAMRYDDVVSAVAEITESFAFQGVKWESSDPDEAQVFNQLSEDLNLDGVIRRMWHEEYAISQFVVAQRWATQDVKMEGTGEGGRRRRKTYDGLWAPQSMHILDSLKVVPVMHSSLGTGALAWSATNDDVEKFHLAQQGGVIDPEMLEFYLSRFTPDQREEMELAALGVDTKSLLLLNPQYVWRHTATKADYERFPIVRLRTIFHYLDLKRQLINADRAQLIGAANYILLVKKGDDKRPATQPEMDNLRENYMYIAKMPVIISDHRLTIEIVAPKTDFVLQPDRYNLIDNRILSRLLGTLTISQQGQRNETNVTLARAVAKSMENRRHMIKRSIERYFMRAVVDHPRNAGRFNTRPRLAFTPRLITLDMDASMIQAVMSMRTMHEISRETILEFFGLDQETEAQRVENEREHFDDIFQTVVPFASNVGPDQGGRPQGGGEGSKNPAKADNKTSNGNPSTS